MTDSIPPAKITAPHAAAWTLDPSIIMLNHGSFGACPLPVLEAQQRFRQQMERNPIA